MADFPWTTSYPAGVRWDAELPLMPVQQILDEAVARWPERPVLDFMGRVISYQELGALVDRAAAGLQQLGVGPGVHVGLYLPNSPHYPIAFFGVLKAGGTVVNYSPLDAERVLEHKVEDSETDILITLDLAALYPQVGRLLGRSRLKKMVVGSLGEYSVSPPAVRAQLEGAGQLCKVPVDDLHVSFEQLLANDGKYQAHAIADLAQVNVVLQYTGGTTGLPKGAMLTPCQPVGGVCAVRGNDARRPADPGRRRGTRARRAAAVPYLFADGEPAARRAPGRAAGAARALRTGHRDERTGGQEDHRLCRRADHVHRHGQPPEDVDA